jgi:threonine dehydratase
VATAAKSLKPDIQIIGAEAALYPSMYQAVHGVMPTSGGASVADGIAVSTPGELTLEITRRLVDDIILVDEPAIETAIQTMLSEAKILSEGAGAVALAALSNHPNLFTGKTIGLIVSGANIDPRILASVSMRGMVRAGQLARLRVTISDRPGALADVSEIIGDSGGNIVEIFHQRLFYDLPVKLAYLDVVVESRDTDHIDEILGALGAAGFAARRLADTDHAD